MQILNKRRIILWPLAPSVYRNRLLHFKGIQQFMWRHYLSYITRSNVYWWRLFWQTVRTVVILIDLFEVKITLYMTESALSRLTALLRLTWYLNRCQRIDWSEAGSAKGTFGRGGGGSSWPGNLDPNWGMEPGRSAWVPPIGRSSMCAEWSLVYSTINGIRNGRPELFGSSF